MRKLTMKPTRRTWILIFGLLAAMAVGFWTLKQGARKAERARPAATAALSPTAAAARTALGQRAGGEVELLYVLEPAEQVACGYYGKKSARPGEPVRASSFVFNAGKVTLAADVAPAEYAALQKSVCGPKWTAQR